MAVQRLTGALQDLRALSTAVAVSSRAAGGHTNPDASAVSIRSTEAERTPGPSSAQAPADERPGDVPSAEPKAPEEQPVAAQDVEAEGQEPKEQGLLSGEAGEPEDDWARLRAEWAETLEAQRLAKDAVDDVIWRDSVAEYLEQQTEAKETQAEEAPEGEEEPAASLAAADGPVQQEAEEETRATGTPVDPATTIAYTLQVAAGQARIQAGHVIDTDFAMGLAFESLAEILNERYEEAEMIPLYEQAILAFRRARPGGEAPGMNLSVRV